MNKRKLTDSAAGGDEPKAKRAKTSGKPASAKGSKGAARDKDSDVVMHGGSGAGSKKGAGAGGAGKAKPKTSGKGSFGAGNSKKGGAGKHGGSAKGGAGAGGKKGSFKAGGKAGKEGADGGEKKLLSRKDRKEMKKERKNAKPNADVIAHANKVYTANLKSMKRPEREAKVAEVLKGVLGKMREISTKHDTSRVLQLVVKHGSAEQRAAVFNELKGTFHEISTNHYGHFLVLKFLQYGREDHKAAVRAEFVGKVRRLATHADAAKVLDYIYAGGKRRTKAWMLGEFYGPDFSSFKQQVDLGIIKVKPAAGAAESKAEKKGAAAGKAGGKGGKAGAAGAAAGDEKDDDKEDKDSSPMLTLETLLAHQPDKKEAVLKSIEEYLDKVIDKQMLMFRYNHGLLVEYFKHASPAKVLEMVGHLSKYIQALHHSPDGARVASLCILYAGPKDRKNIVKTLKGNARPYCLHDDAYLIVLRAIDVVDDTVLMDKNVISDLAAGLDLEFLENPNAAKVLLQLLAPGSTQYFTQVERDFLAADVVDAKSGAESKESKAAPKAKAKGKAKSKGKAGGDEDGDAEMEAEDEDEENGGAAGAGGEATLRNTSKKAPELRRSELLAKLLPALLKSCEDNAAALLRSQGGSRILFEALREGYSRSHQSAAGSTGNPALDKAFKGLAQASVDALTAVAMCSSEPTSTEEQKSVMEDQFGHYVLKRLLKNLKPDGKEFASILLTHIAPALYEFAVTNRGAFVISALIENADEKVANKCIGALLAHRDEIAKSDSPGSKVLVPYLDKVKTGAGAGAGAGAAAAGRAKKG